MEFRENRELAAELKFVVPVQLGSAIRDWARKHLHADPHGGSDEGDEYRICSIYFDTPEFHVFHRKGSYGRSKFRIRQYNRSPIVFLERKLKTKDLVTKRRCAVPIEELELLRNGEETRWGGHWYHNRLKLRSLQPQVQISYQRTARVALTPSGPIRLTVDGGLEALPNSVARFLEGDTLKMFPTHNIIEMKYRGALPVVFKEMVETFGITPVAISKYRVAAVQLGLVHGEVKGIPQPQPASAAVAYA